VGDDGVGVLLVFAAAMLAAAVYLFFVKSLPCDQFCFPAVNGIRG
jgi:hypothetical protein